MVGRIVDSSDLAGRKTCAVQLLQIRAGQENQHASYPIFKMKR